jgi:hypothetical protein
VDLLNDQVFRSQQELNFISPAKPPIDGPPNFVLTGLREFFFTDKSDRSVKLITQIFQTHSTRIMKFVQKGKLRLQIHNVHCDSNVRRRINYLLACLLTYLVTYLLSYLLTYLLTPRSRILLENLNGLKLVKKIHAFMERGSSLPHSQVPSNCPYLEPARSSP